MQQNVKKILFNIQVGELASLARQISSHYDDAKAEVHTDELLTRIMQGEKQEADAIITALTPTKSHSKLDKKDSKRDESISTLFSTVDAYLFIGSEEEKLHAEALKASLARYSGITRLNFANESGYIKAMLAFLAEEEARTHIASLPKVAKAVQAVEEREEEFLQEIKEREAQKINATESASMVKKRLFSILNDQLIPYLNIASVVWSELYSDFAAAVNASIEKANATVSQRSKKASVI